MATEVIKVVDPDSGTGYDYTSLFDWEAAQQGDLTGARNEIAVAKCRCTDGTADSGVTVDGWTTSDTQYFKVWTDTSESYRHNGTYQTGNKFRIEADGRDYSGVVIISEDYGVIDGIQVKPYIAQNASYGNDINFSGTGTLRVSNCILTVDLAGYSTTWWSGIEVSSTGTSIVNNCLIYDIYYAAGTDANIRGININGGTPTLYAYNCTIKHCNTGLQNSVGAAATFIAKNCGVTGCDVAASANVTQTTCSTSAPTFVSASDFHLDAADTTWIGQGTNLYNDATYPFQTDIDGQDRGGSGAQWDIGADEYVSSASIELEGFRFRNDDGSESAATWKASQDTNITLAAGAAFRLRNLLNATGDPASMGAQLECSYKPSGGSYGSWRKVDSV